MDNQQVAWIINMEEAPLHTDDHPYCDDLTCPCHASQHDGDIFSDFWMTDMEGKYNG